MSIGSSASQLLASEAFNEAFDNLRTQLVDQLERGTKTQEAQDLCVTSLQLLARIKEYLVNESEEDGRKNLIEERKKAFGGYVSKLS